MPTKGGMAIGFELIKESSKKISFLKMHYFKPTFKKKLIFLSIKHYHFRFI